MKILPLAFDSFGTRSMSTFVKTEDVSILIDPGTSLAPIRSGYPPHPIELKRLDEHWKDITEFAKKSDILIVTHYHFDHFNPFENLEIYEGKTVLVKHPTEKINYSQKGRAAFFLEQIKDLPKKLEYADGKEFKFGETRVKLSQPVFHGTNPRLGFVFEVLIDDGEYKFIHSSDVEGPSQQDQVDFILQNKPNLVFLDGPLSYMMYRFGVKAMESSVKNMIKILESCPLDALIVDHHFLRDLRWKEKISEVFKAAEKKKVEVKTSAEFVGKKTEMLEAHRKELYQKYPEMKIETTKKILEDNTMKKPFFPYQFRENQEEAVDFII
ncbi:MAG: MBL fold metallo-hydrolase [Candidatus Aenigmarchaeota archaeon]|nr:MBL fold metallo-hydrolase [Candidatus Aenigmarchaeota archaeon]